MASISGRFVAGLAVAVVLPACGPSSEGTGAATGRFGGLHAAVCRATTAAEAGDIARAEDAFDDAHAGLHDLAAAAGQEDRTVAARLLEAKQRVEVEPSAASLRALVAPVAGAIEATGGSAPADCP